MSRNARLIPLQHLIPDPHNERTESDKEAISRLADSIKQHGILQRLLVPELREGELSTEWKEMEPLAAGVAEGVACVA